MKVRKLKAFTGILLSMLMMLCSMPNFETKAYAAAATPTQPDDTDSSGYSFSAELKKFPASYRSALTEIHNKYPKWKIYAQNTGLSFTAAVSKESAGSISLVAGSASWMLKSRLSRDYSSGSYTQYDAGGWVHASPNTVAYFMDPRNFLNVKDIFQFEALSYNSKSHTKSGVEDILKGSFMSNTKVSYINTSGKTVSTNQYYSDLIMTAGKKANVSPYYLASKILTEIGATKSGSVTGNYKGYVGYYNFYNIGASDGADPISNGLYYASTGSSYSRPWTSPSASILGGAQFIASGYIAEGQDTEYYQRFNVSPNTAYPYYTHQYMTNIMAAASQARNTYEAYSEMGMLAYEKVFYIPVYTNMPGADAETSANTVTLSSTSYPQAATVNSNNVNVRKGPNVGYGTFGIRLPSGTKVKVLGKTVSYASTAGGLSPYQFILDPYWAKVEFTYNGTKYTNAYISLTYLDISSSIKVSSSEATAVKYTLNPSSSKDKPYFTTLAYDKFSVSASGSVKAMAADSALVMATTYGRGFDMVTVNGSSDPTGIEISKTSATVYTGKTLTLTANATPSRCNYGSYVWKSSDKTVATVDGSGKVKGIKPGTATITVGVTNNKLTKTVSCKITVKDIGDTEIKSHVNTSATSAKLVWSAAGAADGYRIWEYNNSTKKYTAIATVKDGSATSYTVKNLTCGKTHIFAVRAYRSINGKNVWSKLLGQYSLKAVPAAVKISSASAAGDTSVTVKWSKATDVSGYEVYRATEKNGKYSLIKRLTSASTVSLNNTGLEPASTYYYKVRAYKTVGSSRIYSAYSAAAAVTTDGGSTLTAYKTTDDVNYRTGPGTSYNIAGTLATGKTVNAVDGYSKSANGYTWLKIKIGSSYYYCVSNYLKANETLSTYYATEAVNYRNGPGTSYEIKGSFKAQQQVSVVKGYSKSANGYTWYKVKVGTSYFYCVKNYLSTSSGSQNNTAAQEVLLDYKTTTEVNYRSGAGTSYSIKGTLQSGKAVKVVKGYSKSANGYTWYKIKIGSAYYYCVSEYLRSQSTSSSSSSGTSSGTNTEKLVSYQTTDSVNYRSGTGTSYSIKGTFSQGKTVNVVDSYSKTADGYTWYKIKIGSAYYYCVKNYLTKVSTSGTTASAEKLVSYKTTSEVNYRSGAGTSYGVKGTLATGKTVNVVDGYSKSANGYTWYKIKIGTAYYYCVSNYLKAVSTSTAQPQEKLVKYTTTDSVNYRSGAGTGYDVKGTLATGKAVNVVDGYSKTANGYKWYKIKIGTAYYYCVSNYLKAA